MNGPLFEKLSRTSWPRRLTPAESAVLREWLASHPDARADWEVEGALSEHLARLPDAPVPANFTARVLQGVELDQRAAERPSARLRWSWRFFLPRAAAAAVALTLGIVTFEQHRRAERAERAPDVAALSAVAAVPEPELLRDSDVIRKLGSSPMADVELIALFQ